MKKCYGQPAAAEDVNDSACLRLFPSSPDFSHLQRLSYNEDFLGLVGLVTQPIVDQNPDEVFSQWDVFFQIQPETGRQPAARVER